MLVIKNIINTKKLNFILDNMKSIKEIKTKNYKGQFHGYQEWYLVGRIRLRCIMKHDVEIGYEEWHEWDETNYYIR